MLRIHRFVLIAVAIALTPVTSAAQLAKPDSRRFADTAARAIFDRHTKAIGRSTSQSPYQHRVIETRMNDSVISRSESFSKKPDKVLTVITLPGFGTTQTGYDGKIGWSLSPMTGPVLLEGEPLRVPEASVGGAAANAMDTSARFGTLGRETIAGRVVNAILSASASGDTVTLYFDVETGLLTASRTRSYRGQPVDTANLILFGDYKRFDNVLMSTKVTIHMREGELVSQTILFDRDPIDSAKFALPAAVLSLLPRRP